MPDLTLKASPVAPARSEVKQLNEYHQTLMKLRLEGGLDGIELGPVLGQGSFGRVYKGAVSIPHTRARRAAALLLPTRSVLHLHSQHAVA